MSIRLLVTKERYYDVVSIDQDMHFLEMSNRDAYDLMLKFVVDKDGKYLEEAEARQLFKKIPRKEFARHLEKLIKGITDAFVDPTSGAASNEPSSQE